MLPKEKLALVDRGRKVLVLLLLFTLVYIFGFYCGDIRYVGTDDPLDQFIVDVIPVNLTYWFSVIIVVQFVLIGSAYLFRNVFVKGQVVHNLKMEEFKMLDRQKEDGLITEKEYLREVSALMHKRNVNDFRL